MLTHFDELFNFTRDNHILWKQSLNFNIIFNKENIMVKQVHLIHAFEQLSAMDEETDVVKKTALLKKYGSMLPLNYILSMNYRSDVLFDLPEGMPELDLKHLDMATHPDFVGLLSNEIHKLFYCKTGSAEGKLLKQEKKEQLFYNLLINCPIGDAEIVCSAKDKALLELYPSITKEFVASVFPAYVKD